MLGNGAPVLPPHRPPYPKPTQSGVWVATLPNMRAAMPPMSGRTEAGSTVQEGVNWGDMAVYFSRHLGGPFLELVRFHRDRFHHDQFLRLQHSVVNCGARAFTHF